MDAIDIEQLDDAVRSAGYALIAERYARMIEAKVREIVQPLDPIKTAEVRGYLQGVQACQRVPHDLKKEVENGKNKKAEGRKGHRQ